MKLFIDTANLEEIKAANEMGIICGVTTNPSLIAKEGRNIKQVVEEIASIVDGPISAEVISLEVNGMVAEARELVKIHRNIVIKLPLTADGLKAINILSKEGIKTNATLIFSANQAILAAEAGANYVSPFVGRVDDTGVDGMILIQDLCQIFKASNYATEIIVASVRSPLHVIEAAKLGADIATVPFKVIKQMINHPQTDLGIEKFLADWETVRDK